VPVRISRRGLSVVLFVLWAAPVFAQSSSVAGTVRIETHQPLPGVAVELRLPGAASVRRTETDAEGRYRFDGLPPGRTQLVFSLVNFSSARREIALAGGVAFQADVVLYVAMSAEVTVTGKSTFTNLADAPDPTRSLLGIAQSASQGAITAKQLEARPIMRSGEILETVPGVVISQHSGEGKANQYYLRGFNLDHGTDFATTVAGMPVNMPTHGHGHG
jgi:carboxypeptidase family protein/TonB-dependent receptor-like protein